jgi:bifunctional non-homologous end joining protein LigD
MPLARHPDAFDDPAWFFELKYDGFRSLALATGGGTKLVSRHSRPYRQFADAAVLDGEIVKLDDSGRLISST